MLYSCAVFVWTKTSHTIPLLKRLRHLMLIRFDIRLLPVQVGSKTNARADALSRGVVTYIALDRK